MSNLCLHAGGKVVSWDDLRGVECPAATATWKPVPHHAVLEHVRGTLDAAGYEVQRQQLALNRHGQQFFAVLDLANRIGGDGGLSIGVRNSMDKSFPMGMVGGARVFVCDNLAFSADLMNVKRKHTRYGELRFSEAIAGAVARIPQFCQQEEDRAALMHATRLDAETCEVLALRSAIDWNLLPLRHVPAIVQETRKPTFAAMMEGEPDDGRVSLWRLWNAYTHVLRGHFERMPGRAALLTMRLQRRLLAATAEPAEPVNQLAV